MNAGDWREWQEPVLRWTATGVFTTCAITFCTTLGDLSFTGSLGWFFGVLFSGVPGFVLWGHELYEAGVRRDRAELNRQGTSMGRLLRDEDDDTPPQGTGRVRDVHYGPRSQWPDDDD